MRSMLVGPGCAAMIWAAACGGGSAGASEQPDAAAEAAGAQPARSALEDRNACRLLTGQEVIALVGKPVALANVIESSPTYSECQWEDDTGFVLFSMGAHWSGGRETFDVWRTAQAFGDEIFERQEGVRTDDIVQQGAVLGLGDAAYFSEIFPSMVLDGDRLIMMSMMLVPDASTKFRPLARTLLGRM